MGQAKVRQLAGARGEAVKRNEERQSYLHVLLPESAIKAIEDQRKLCGVDGENLFSTLLFGIGMGASQTPGFVAAYAAYSERLSKAGVPPTTLQEFTTLIVGAGLQVLQVFADQRVAAEEKKVEGADGAA